MENSIVTFPVPGKSGKSEKTVFEISNEKGRGVKWGILGKV